MSHITKCELLATRYVAEEYEMSFDISDSVQSSELVLGDRAPSSETPCTGQASL